MANPKRPEKQWREEEEERKHFRHDLEEVGENLPEHFRGVEGADVSRVVRHDGEEAHEDDFNPLLHKEPDVDEGDVHLVEDEEEDGARRRRASK